MTEHAQSERGSERCRVEAERSMTAPKLSLMLATYCCTCMRLPGAVESQQLHAGRSTIERGCITNGGGEYVVDMVFDDLLVGGVTTSLKVVLDTGSANLQIMSDKCPTCRNLTSKQYPGPVRGPTFEVSGIFGTRLGHATAAVRFGEFQADAVELSAIVSVSPRFFQGAAHVSLCLCLCLSFSLPLAHPTTHPSPPPTSLTCSLHRWAIDASTHTRA